VTETIAGRLTAALADRYAIERQVGQGGMATREVLGWVPRGPGPELTRTQRFRRVAP
jgi:hypothetical protein